MSSPKKNFKKIAAAYLKSYSFAYLSAMGAEYFDELAMQANWMDEDAESFALESLSASSQLTCASEAAQKIACKITRKFEESLKTLLQSSQQIQEEILGIHFDIADVNAFLEICYNKTPLYISSDAEHDFSVVQNWLTKSYAVYLERIS